MRDDMLTSEVAPAAQGHPAEGDEAIRVAVDAAEIGTWNWHIATGDVAWTPRTYQLFGVKPGAFATSYKAFLEQVHAGDRPNVVQWLEQALRSRGRTALEFRIERADGAVRWIRSTGRVIVDERGRVVRMAGVVEDVTERREAPPSAKRDLEALPRASGSLSVRQLARVLGIGEATVKRLAAAGGIEFLRSSRKNSRRFAAEHVVEYLRNRVSGARDFESAVQAEDMNACVLSVLEASLEGTALEALLDERVWPAASGASPPFISDLLSRMPFLVPQRQRAGFPALLVRAGAPQPCEEEFIACVLRARGHEVLRPAGHPSPRQVADLTERVRARVVVVAIAVAPAGIHASDLAAATEIVALVGGATVCVRCDGRVRVPPGALRFSSMRDLAALLPAAARGR